MLETTVVNCKHEAFDVLIGRGSPFGNPFIIGVHGNREQVIEKYRNWVLTQPLLLAKMEELRGKRLGCWCKPKACHGDVILSILEGSANAHEKVSQGPSVEVG